MRVGPPRFSVRVDRQGPLDLLHSTDRDSRVSPSSVIWPACADGPLGASRSTRILK